jgi:CheY-like chemotaxis protein
MAGVEREVGHMVDGSRGESPGVLLIDDDDAVRATLADLLRYLGCEVIEARGGAEALLLARRQGARLRVALVDMNLPGMSGREVCRRLKGLMPDLPLVLITGYDVGDLLDTSARYLLEKPFGIKTLASVLQRLGVPLGTQVGQAA